MVIVSDYMEKVNSTSGQTFVLLELSGGLELVQSQNIGDITAWLVWFLTCMKHALLAAEKQLDAVLWKVDFWKKHDQVALNHRQRLMLTKLMHEFQGKLQSSKWAKMAHCSHDTALRDINDLISKGILRQEMGGGRNTTYELIP